jgi:hypothetical protein
VFAAAAARHRRLRRDQPFAQARAKLEEHYGFAIGESTIQRITFARAQADLFAFLATEPNAIVAPIHAKAMPVILRTQADIDLWMTAPAQEALTLQRPLPDDDLQIVARGGKSDGLAEDQQLISPSASVARRGLTRGASTRGALAHFLNAFKRVPIHYGLGSMTAARALLYTAAYGPRLVPLTGCGPFPLRLMRRSMQYRVQFLDRSDNVIREVRADDSSARSVLFRRGVNRACPPHGVRMRVLDAYGRSSVSRNLGGELLA